MVCQLLMQPSAHVVTLQVLGSRAVYNTFVFVALSLFWRKLCLTDKVTVAMS